MFGRAGMQGQPPGGQMGGLSPSENMAMKGRFGDTIIAHLTPGEITIPVQLQSPAVLKAIRDEFMKAKVDPSKFVAGSPTGSKNPATGAQEFSFLGGALPSILGLVGGVGGGMLGGPVGAAIGSGLGSAGGEAANGGNITQDLVTGGAAGLGSLAAPAIGNKLGGMFGGAASGAGAGGAASGAAGTVASGLGAGSMLPSASLGNSLAGAASNAGAMAASPIAGAAAAPAATSAPGLLGQLMSSRSLGAFTGAGIGASLAGPINPSNGTPAGFNTPRPPTSPQFNQALGSPNASGVSFGGYNPVQSVTGQGGPAGYDFYSPTGNGQQP